MLVQAGQRHGDAGNRRYARRSASVLRHHDFTAVQFARKRWKRRSTRIGDRIAAIIVEPVAGNMGCVPPAPGFLEALREITQRAGALLIFDEVMTGFRVAFGGAQQLYGVDARPHDAG